MGKGYPSSCIPDQDPISIIYSSDMYSCIIMMEHSLCTLQNQVMHIAVERLSAGYPWSIIANLKPVHGLRCCFH